MSIEFAFDLPFAAAIAQAASRDIELPDKYYEELQGAARARAFTVSGMAALDQIKGVLDAASKVLEQGGTLKDFKEWADINPQFGILPAHRKELIFRNAIQTAYQCGQWDSFYKHEFDRPYLMYDAINDARTRPNHVALDGFIAPVGDSVWNSISPQNGHNCRCALRSLSEKQAHARGYIGAPKALPVEAHADEGWDYHPNQRDKKLAQLQQEKENQAPFSTV